jgi:hypothetical protein
MDAGLPLEALDILVNELQMQGVLGTILQQQTSYGCTPLHFSELTMSHLKIFANFAPKGAISKALETFSRFDQLPLHIAISKMDVSDAASADWVKDLIRASPRTLMMPFPNVVSRSRGITKHARVVSILYIQERDLLSCRLVGRSLRGQPGALPRRPNLVLSIPSKDKHEHPGPTSTVSRRRRRQVGTRC